MQLLVLGMSGSGASLIVDALNEMGFYNGSSLEIGPASSDPQEGHNIESIHRRLLDSMELAWDRISTFDVTSVTQEQRHLFLTEAKSLVQKLDIRKPWMLFDIHLCLTASFWRPILDQPVYLYVYRNPGEIVASLNHSTAAGLALWELYTVRSVMDTADIPCIMVSYNKFVKDPVNQIRKLYKALVRAGGQSLNKPAEKIMQQLVVPHLQATYKNTIFRDHATDSQLILRDLYRKGKLFGLTEPKTLSVESAKTLIAFEKQWTLNRELVEHRRAIIQLEKERSELSRHHEQAVMQLEKERSELSQRHTEKQTTRYQDNAALHAEIAQLRSHLHRTVRLVEKIHHDTRDLFHSWTWSIGRFFVDLACRMTLKKPNETARDHIDRIITDFYNWRDKEYASLTSRTGNVRISLHEISSENGATAKANILPLPRDGRTKLIYISPNLPDFDRSSGGRRATRMLALLAEECDVYAFTLGEKPEKYIQALNKYGVVVLDTYDYNEITQKIPHVDVLIYGWFYTYYDADAFRVSYPNAKVIVDSVDVHWVREERSLGHHEELTYERMQANKHREVDAYQAAGIVWTVTEPDKDAILKEIPKADIRLVSNIHAPVISRYAEPDQKNILFFGGFGHYPNISAAKKLALVILPEIRKKISDVQLIIAGAKAPEEITDLARLPGVDFRGFIEEDDVEALYQETFITVAPLLMGSGIKGKICESIAYMTPVVTNSVGNEGIQLEHGEQGLITDDFDEMAALVVQAMQGQFDLATMTKNAQTKLQALVGPDIVKERMLWSIKRGISICIVTHNRLQLLMRCIDSILEDTKYCNYKIVVYSNGCTDGTQDYLQELALVNNKVIPVLSDENDVFVRPNNQMMMMYPDSDVVLLNNDVYVTPNWLNGLRNAAYASDHYGVTGSKILYPDGRLQEFGSEIYADGTGRNVGKNDDPGKPEYNGLTETGYVSGCAMFIKRSTIQEIGVFDEDFHPCYFEDTDYCYTAKEHGLMTVVTPESVVYHDEGGTAGTDASDGFKKYQSVNVEKFIEKHRGKDNGINWSTESKE